MSSLAFFTNKITDLEVIIHVHFFCFVADLSVLEMTLPALFWRGSLFFEILYFDFFQKIEGASLNLLAFLDFSKSEERAKKGSNQNLLLTIVFKRSEQIFTCSFGGHKVGEQQISVYRAPLALAHPRLASSEPTSLCF